ncbi:MAG: WYL domain-containing protein [Burkholderiales bacterium]|nr:WYL domain-containing protein [Burkholderiales bacterium]
MSESNHDTLVYRLAQILLKFNQGESLDPADLADEFRVNVRTIQRDLNVRFAYLPLQRVDGRYRLDPAYLGKLNTRDIERFAGLAGVSGLFPSFSDDFLRDIFDAQMQATLLVKGHHYEDMSGKEDLFRQLEQAIVSRRRIGFRYTREDAEKIYADVEPYKLLNQKGIWYLAARHEGKLKTFAFTRISGVHMSDQAFVPDPDVERRLTQEDGIWFTDQPQEVVLRVAKEVAGYFKRRNLIANQVIQMELQDGGLIVSARIGHLNQILPIVRYWIPHIQIVSPEGLQADLEASLSEYLRSSVPVTIK